MSLNFGNNLFPARNEQQYVFDYKDLISGNGYIEYYLLTMTENGEEIKTLTQNKLKTNDFSITESFSGDQTIASKKIDEDFDLRINKSTIIKGDAFMTLVYTSSMDAGNDEVWGEIKIKKVRNDIEEIIGEGKSLTRLDPNLKTFEEIIKIPINENAFFKEGDILRITIEMWIKRPSFATTKNVAIYFDPTGIQKTAKNYNKPASEGDVYQYAQEKAIKILIPFKVEQ